MGVEAAMRRNLTPAIILAVVGLLVGGLFRYAFDRPDRGVHRRTVRAAPLRAPQSLLIVWATHLYLAARGGWLRGSGRSSSSCLRRSVILAVTVAVAAIVLEVVLNEHGIDAKFFAKPS